MKAKVRIEWWKLKKEECCAGFWGELKQALGCREDRGKLLGISSGKRTRVFGDRMRKYRK